MSDKKPAHIFSPEKLSTMSKVQVETIRQNALNKGVADLVAMCDDDLSARKPKKSPRSSAPGVLHGSDEFVEGYHFVCERDRGVTDAGTGKFWTGSWVVAPNNVETSLKYNSYVALHESKADMSYRQGRILDYRKSARNMLADKNDGDTKVEEGIEFLIEEQPRPHSWHGGGSGEKGYKWAKVSRASSEMKSDEVTQ